MEIPLFPLHTVLFPGAPLLLHIFEPRYQEMIRICLEQERPFGVVLIRKGVEAMGPLAEPHAVGCTAEIVDMQRLGGGRMNLTTLGRNRFRLLSLDSRRRPYLTAEVAEFPLQDADSPPVDAAVPGLQGWVDRYLEHLARVRSEQYGPVHLSGGNAAKIFLAASLLQIPLVEKQALLAQESAHTLLSGVLTAYRREVVLLQAQLRQGGSSPGTFSRN